LKARKLSHLADRQMIMKIDSQENSPEYYGNGVPYYNLTAVPYFLPNVTLVDPYVIVSNCFVRCVHDQMTANQCEYYIKGVLGPVYAGSAIPDLEMVVSTPRPLPVKANSYWYIGIPTNFEGETDCSAYGGTIKFLDPWETSLGVFSIPDVDCFGLLATDCCDKVLQTVEDAGIPLQDVFGNCLSCWVHQQILTPVTSDNSVLYETKEASGGSCVSKQMTSEYVQGKDKEMMDKLAELSNEIDGVIESGASCEQLKALQRDLLFWARSKSHSMKTIASLLCSYTCDNNGPLTDQIVSDLHHIKSTIAGEIKSDVNQIIIYTDHQGYVMDSPIIGESSEIVYHPKNDTGCGYYVYYGGGTGYYVDPYYYYTNGTQVTYDHGICSAIALSDQSGSGQPCFACRSCLLSSCDWSGAQTSCQDMLNGNTYATPEMWAACLQSNGASDVPVTELNFLFGFTSWSSCAIDCEASCLKEDYTYIKDPRMNECNSVDLYKGAGDNEWCYLCRMCLQQECNHWDQQSSCAQLLNGEYVDYSGTPEEWLACLESDGTSNTLQSLPMTSDGNRDTWSECGRRCDSICVKEQYLAEVDAPEVLPICEAEDIAVLSATPQDPCYSCRDCIAASCNFGNNDCHLLATGMSIGSGEEWLACLTSCGGGGLRKGRSLLNGSSSDRSDWCECSRLCDQKCFFGIISE